MEILMTANNLTIAAGTLLFFVLALLLVVILLVAKKYLVPSGNLRLKFNDTISLEVPTCCSLLS